MHSPTRLAGSGGYDPRAPDKTGRQELLLPLVVGHLGYGLRDRFGQLDFIVPRDDESAPIFTRRVEHGAAPNGLEGTLLTNADGDDWKTQHPTVDDCRVGFTFASREDELRDWEVDSDR